MKISEFKNTEPHQKFIRLVGVSSYIVYTKEEIFQKIQSEVEGILSHKLDKHKMSDIEYKIEHITLSRIKLLSTDIQEDAEKILKMWGLMEE